MLFLINICGIIIRSAVESNEAYRGIYNQKTNRYIRG